MEILSLSNLSILQKTLGEHPFVGPEIVVTKRNCIIPKIERAKDENGRKYGVNETNRRIKTYFISSVDYFDKKIPVIKDLCESNNARAYILP